MPVVIKTITYHYRLCPFCKSRLGLVHTKVQMGSPIVQCGSCDWIFTEDKCQEWESMSSLQRANQRLEAVSGPMLGWGLGTYGLALFLYVALAMTVPAVMAMNRALPFGSFLVIPAVAAVPAAAVVGSRRGRVLERAIAESAARMADPVYRQRLRDLGVKVTGGPLPDVQVELPNANHRGAAELWKQEQWTREYERRRRSET